MENDKVIVAIELGSSKISGIAGQILFDGSLKVRLGMLLGLQAFINMSVAVGLFPVTGQPLPLISKGGTSVLMASGCIGMLLGISNTLDREEKGEQMMGTDADVPAPVDGNESFDEIN